MAACEREADGTGCEARVRGEHLWLYRMLEPSWWYPATRSADGLSLELETPEGRRSAFAPHFIVRQRRPTPSQWMRE